MVSNAHYAPTPITVPEEEIKPYVAPMLSNPVLSGRALGIAATLYVMQCGAKLRY